MLRKMIDIGTHAFYFTLEDVEVILDAFAKLEEHLPAFHLLPKEQDIVSYLEDKKAIIERSYDGHRTHRS